MEREKKDLKRKEPKGSRWQSAPKVELHCHLDGSLSRAFVESRLGRKVSVRELQVEPDCRSLPQYLEKFDLPLACLQDEEGLQGAGYDFIRSVSGEHVRYAEVRFAPSLSAHGDLTCGRVIRAVLEGLERGRQDFGTEYNVIVCAMRGQAFEQNLSMLRAAREFLGQGVCAADLAGNEAAWPMSEYRELFAEARKMGMPFTIHAGECGSAANIRDALDAGAARIGHGIAMRGQDALKALCRERGTGIEMCPVSNLQTRAVERPEDYPLREFLDAGLKVTVNTDNRTVSGSTLSGELAFVQEMYGIREEEIFLLLKNAVDVSFADDSVKQKLYRELADWKEGRGWTDIRGFL